MNFDKANDVLKNKKVIEVVGTSDPYLTEVRLKELNDLNNRINIHPEIIEFEGGHEINEPVLQGLMKQEN
jgi:predicted esterase